MIIALQILLVLTLILIFYQDLKERQVYWFLFPLFGLCSAVLFYLNTLPELFLVYIGINAIVIAILLLVVYFYTKLKLKMKFNAAFGLGDVLLFISLIFSFATLSFLVIFVFGLCFSLILHLIVKRHSKHKTVPLAGYMSLFFALAYVSYWAGLTNTLYIL